MTMSEKELERRLIDAGNRLLSPPSSVTELLDSLDLVENLLVGVEQSPSGSMKEALVPSTKALIRNELVRHPDVDVKVAVASCISEITRITAPDAPYADEQMKEIFQLIVSSFDKLDDKSSRSYTKRISILDTVAKVRSCVVMLDLECDALIVEMFRHFFKTIRDDHHGGVLISMETIMTLVIEESEDISEDLLSSILDVLRKDNRAVLPVARQLGERVIVSCAKKLKPFLLPAVRSSGRSLTQYSKVVSDVYKVGDEAVEPSTGDPSMTNLADDLNLINRSSEKAEEVAMETLKGAPPLEEALPNTIGSSKTVMSNGVLQKGKKESSAANENSEGADDDTQDEKGEPSLTNAVSVNAPEPPKSKAKPKKAKKRKGKKTNSSKKKSSKPLEPVESNSDNPEDQDDPMDVDNLESGNPAVDITDADNHEKSSDAPIVSPGKSDNEHADISLKEKTQSKKARQGKNKQNTIQEGETAGDVDSGKESDTEKDSEEPIGSKNRLKDSSKNASASDHEDSGPDSADDTKEESDTTLEEDDIPAKDLAKETKVGGKLADKKKRGQAKATPMKGKKKTPAKDERKKASNLSKSTSKVTKDESDVEEASRSKRKRVSEEKTPKTNVNGRKLVGATVKVWWPDDKKYYEGVIDSYDATEEKHTIHYNDGDVEILNLEAEKWQLISDPKGHASENPDESADETPKGKKAKTNADLGSKQGKSLGTSKKSVSTSSKSKTTPKFAGNFKEESTKKVVKSDAKAKASGNKLSAKTVSKSATKSKRDDDDNDNDDDDEDTPIGSIKSKQETAKGAAKSKGKSPKIVGGKSISSAKNAKAKGGTSAKDDEDDDSEDESLEPEKSPEKLKIKSKRTPAKSQMSSKKRRR